MSEDLSDSPTLKIVFIRRLDDDQKLVNCWRCGRDRGYLVGIEKWANDSKVTVLCRECFFERLVENDAVFLTAKDYCDPEEIKDVHDQEDEQPKLGVFG